MRIAIAAAMIAALVPVPAAHARPTTGMLLNQTEINALPASGPAFSAIASNARASWPAPRISDQDNKNDTYALAGALYYAKTGDAAMRTKVRNAIVGLKGTERGGRALALGRNLQSYVLAADLIDLKRYSRSDDAAFRRWLSGVRRAAMSGACSDLIACHEKRPNNWGTHAGAARIAADIYLGDRVDLARAATVLRGYLGERSAYAGFKYGERSWQADPSAPVGINPAGARRDGVNVDGVLPDDQRRGGVCCALVKENYVYEALQGTVVQAYLLKRQGFDAWSWGGQAIRRAFLWAQNVNGFPAEGDDTWVPWMANKAYGLTLPATTPTRPGKGFGYADWFAA
jgi:hypothetical protein